MTTSLTFYDTVVIGAGIAGLSYAYYFFLQEQKQPYSTKKLLLLEKNPFVGGRMVSYQIDSKNFIELGPARFHESHIKLLELCKFCNLSYSEIKSKKVLTFKNSFSSALLEPSAEIRKKQLDEPYKLNQKEITLLTQYQYNTEKLLLDLIKQIIPENISFYDYAKEKLGANLTQVLQHTDGFSFNWGMAAKEAASSLREMYDPQQKWFSLNQSMESFAQILLTKLISSDKKIIDCQLLCNVSHISFEQNQQLFRIGKTDPLSGTCSVLCKNLILAVDTYGLKELIQKNNLSAIFSEKIDLAKELQILQPYNLLRMYAIFEKDRKTNKYWFENSPIIYSASKLQMIIPTSLPGVLQFSYSDGKNANSWVELIKKIPSQIIKEGRTWVITHQENAFVHQIMTELSLMFPNVNISRPTLIIAHLCHVMQLLPNSSQSYPLPSKIFRPSKRKDFAIIGEATCLADDLGIASSWLESAIRSSFKAFNHLNQKENRNILKLKN